MNKPSDVLFDAVTRVNEAHGENLKARMENKMSEPDYDAHIEPRYRKRHHDDIEDNLSDEYSAFIKKLADEAKAGSNEKAIELFKKLLGKHRSDAIDQIAELVFEQNGSGRNDEAFMQTIDLEAISYEVY